MLKRAASLARWERLEVIVGAFLDAFRPPLYMRRELSINSVDDSSMNHSNAKARPGATGALLQMRCADHRVGCQRPLLVRAGMTQQYDCHRSPRVGRRESDEYAIIQVKKRPR